MYGPYMHAMEHMAQHGPGMHACVRGTFPVNLITPRAHAHVARGKGTSTVSPTNQSSTPVLCCQVARTGCCPETILTS